MASLLSEGPFSQRHVFEVAELVQIICTFLTKEDCINLLYVSHRTYACVQPVVWEDVDLGLALRLIPGVTVKTAMKKSAGSLYVFNFPTILDLSRFNVHAAFIRTLRTYHPYSIKFPSNWPSSSASIASNRPFPKLQRIAVHSSDGIEAEGINWISELLHSDLLGLEFLGTEIGRCYANAEDEHPWLDHDVSFDLIRQISRACPNIQTLSIFPTKIEESDEGNRILTYESLASLPQLRSFTFNGTIIHEELLQALGRLPHLDTLSFCTDGNETWYYDESSLNLSDDSFPSLRRLFLHDLDEFTLARVCHAAPLFRRLVSAAIIFEGAVFDENTTDSGRSKLAVASLGQNSPDLRDLTILPRDDDGYFVVSWPIVEAFKQMHLQSLDLGEITLDSGDDEESEESDSKPEDEEEREERRGRATRNRPPPVEWADFLAAVPNLEELRMERQEIKPHDLRILASALPHLRLLTIGTVPLGDAEQEAQEATYSHKMVLSSWSYFKAKKEREEDKVPDTNSALNAAKYLHAIWLNVTCETHGIKWGYRDVVLHEQALAKLNEALETLKSKDT